MVLKIMILNQTHLLDASNVSGNIFDRDRIFHSQSVTLAFCSRPVNQYSAVGRKPYITA